MNASKRSDACPGAVILGSRAVSVVQDAERLLMGPRAFMYLPVRIHYGNILFEGHAE